MPLVFASIVPHPPLLVPTIGKENTRKLKRTKDAFLSLERELYASNVETFIIISPHAPIFSEAFGINLAAHYSGSFETFGDHATQFGFLSDVSSIQAFRASCETPSKGLPSIVIINKPNIDFGAAVPLYFLTPHLKEIRIIPISYSLLSVQHFFSFGKYIGERIFDLDKRFAIIASADLSHQSIKPLKRTRDRISACDSKILQCIKEKDVRAILHWKQEFLDEAKSCGIPALAFFFGSLDLLKYEMHIWSYENPFGAGYVVASAKFL